MVIRRDARTPIIRAGKQFGTSRAIETVKAGVDDGSIRTRQITLQEGDRLDVIAGREYGDSRNWWIIAAASGIGWGLQVPPGTRILIPTDLSQVAGLVG